MPRQLKNYETGQNYLIALAFSHVFDPIGPLVEVLDTVSSSTVVGPNDVVILLTGSTLTITLPPPTAGRVLVFKDASGNANVQPKVIVAPGGATIDGASTFTLNIAYAAVRLTSDGTNWFVTAAYNGTVV